MQHRRTAPILRFLAAILVPVLGLAGCASAPGPGAAGPGAPGTRVLVQGAAPEMLKLRAGPGLGYRVIAGLPDDTVLIRRGCTREEGQVWCEVSLDEAPRLRGYVAADYLSG